MDDIIEESFENISRMTTDTIKVGAFELALSFDSD